MTNKIIAFAIIVQLESSNGANMVNATNTQAVGWTQMLPIAVEDCNRIIGKPKYSLESRMDLASCWEMYEIIVDHYLGKEPSMEDIALLWKCGNVGRKRPLDDAAKRYLEKFEIAFKEYLREHYE